MVEDNKGGVPMKKATRFTFTNNKDTALTAPEKLVLARPDETDSDADPQTTVGKSQKFVTARKQDYMMEEKKTE